MNTKYDVATNSFKPWSIKKIKNSDVLFGVQNWGGETTDFPGDLIGAEIINIGVVLNHNLENGFLIDYLPSGCKKVRRIVFCSTELGIWIEGKCKL